MTVDAVRPTAGADAAASVRTAETPRLPLLDAMPELRRAVPHKDFELAHRALVAPVVAVPQGAAVTDGGFSGRPPLARVVIEGLVLRRTRVADRVAAELLGPGDVLCVDTADEGSAPAMHIEHVAHRACRIVLLDDRFRLAACRWPRLHDVVHGKAAAQISRASHTLATLHLPRVEERLLAVLGDLATRWGRVTPDGVVLDVTLTHSLLGELVGARRPTVSLALADLAEAGLVTRAADGGWLLSRVPSG